MLYYGRFVLHQDVIQVKQDGLYVTLDESKNTKRIFKHSEADEIIELYFQSETMDCQQLRKNQIRCSLLKKGKSYQYQYIFDAKYRIDFAGNPHYKRKYDTPTSRRIHKRTMQKNRRRINRIPRSNNKRT
ncbi:nuclease domain-containing protein [Bacillus mycoides]|uniref:nuclease domain-containing protein n=1 Tax=Bacillus mycoides TaxID=1405 RepID=UPI003F7B4CE6